MSRHIAWGMPEALKKAGVTKAGQFNPNHEPAGSGVGGRFASGGGASPHDLTPRTAKRLGIRTDPNPYYKREPFDAAVLNVPALAWDHGYAGGGWGEFGADLQVRGYIQLGRARKGFDRGKLARRAYKQAHGEYPHT